MVFIADSLSTPKGLQTAGDQYFNFIGSNYIEATTYKGVRGDTARSVEAWIKTTVADKEIVSWGTDGGQKYVIRLDAAGKLRIETNGGSAVATTVLTDGKWHHIAVVQAGNNVQSVTFYVDGIIDNKTALTNQTINTGNTYKVRVSRGVNNRYWLGEIEEVRIWSGVLTQTAVQDWMYRAVDNTHAFYSDLELYYPFNEGTGAAIADASGKGRNATAMGGTFGVDTPE